MNKLSPSKILKERKELGHGRGHADKKTFALLKKHFESVDCEVTVIKEKGNKIYFKVLSKHQQQTLGDKNS